MESVITYLLLAPCVQDISSTVYRNASIVHMLKTVHAIMLIQMAARVIDIILLLIHA
jgi:hypothetical protein